MPTPSNPEPPNWNYPQPPRDPWVPEPIQKGNSMGWFLKGCITVILILLVLGILAIGGLYIGTNKLRDRYTTDHPVPITECPTTPNDVTDPHYEAVIQKINQFQTALKADQPATLELTLDELNLLVAKCPDLNALRGKVYFTKIENGQLFADTSIPLTGLHIPALKNRWLNGKISFEVGMDEGVPNIQLAMLEVNNQTASSEFLSSFSEQLNKQIRKDFLDALHKKTEGAVMLHRIHDVDLKDHKIVLSSLGHNPDSEKSSPTPEAP